VHLAEKIAEYLRAAGLDVRIVEPVAFALVGLAESAATRWLDSPGGVSSEELSTDLTGWAWAVVDQATRSAGLTLDPHAIMPRPAELMAYPPPRGRLGSRQDVVAGPAGEPVRDGRAGVWMPHALSAAWIFCISAEPAPPWPAPGRAVPLGRGSPEGRGVPEGRGAPEGRPCGTVIPAACRHC